MERELGEGERLLRELAKLNDEARYELGQLLLKGNGLAKDEAAGFEMLLSLAESGHPRARTDVQIVWLEWYHLSPVPEFRPPAWAVPFLRRLRPLWPDVPLPNQ